MRLAKRWRAVVAAALMALGAPAAQAQNPFSIAIAVNDRAITFWEIEQRILLLEAFRTQGDLRSLAREQLVEDRLKQDLFARIGLSITDEGLQEALEEFAGRADLTLEQFVTALEGNGIAEETFVAFVEIGVTWRDYIRATYGNRARISEAEIDAAIGTAGGSGYGIEVLLSEIILPARPERPQEVAQSTARAERIAGFTSLSAFEAAAREFSALPSRDVGGRLDWLPIGNYPAPIRPVILDLAVGEVTAPIAIPNGIALFQLRGVREVAEAPPVPALIDYAVLSLPPGADGLTQATGVAARVDTCDDLYGVAQGLSPDRLIRTEEAPSAIPAGIAVELAKLDAGEVSFALASEQARLFVMLCSRTAEEAVGADRDSIETQLRNQRLSGYADALLEDLRAAAVIEGS